MIKEKPLTPRDMDALFDDAEVIRNIGAGTQIGPGRAWVSLFEKRLEARRKEIEDKPRECPEDARKDWRYIEGAIGELRWLLELPGRVTATLEGIET